MAKESKFHIEQQDVIFYENFLDEASVRRNGGVPSIGGGAVLPTFLHGECTFDGAFNYIEYPRYKLRLCDPERPFTATLPTLKLIFDCWVEVSFITNFETMIDFKQLYIDMLIYKCYCYKKLRHEL